MSDEIKKTVLNTLAEPLANSAKNITDKPTQNMGTTLADIWYLVFGGISQVAEKRKLKYFYALQEYENELKKKVSKIPEDKLAEPDIQIIAPTLEASKYCIENKELRTMFSNLISSSIHIDINNYVQPIFIDILKNLNQLECQILNSIYNNHTIKIKGENDKGLLLDIFLQISIALNQLNSYGLTKFDTQQTIFTSKDKRILLQNIKEHNIGEILTFFNLGDTIQKMEVKTDNHIMSVNMKLKVLPMTPLGIAFKLTCIDGIDKNNKKPH